ncbi:hypothetical protein GQ600_8178 [Phytophthora cactorum]|nr:hypothetical protein GQ600_8178 [Phytophthora cactorum]
MTARGVPSDRCGPAGGAFSWSSRRRLKRARDGEASDDGLSGLRLVSFSHSYLMRLTHSRMLKEVKPVKEHESNAMWLGGNVNHGQKGTSPLKQSLDSTRWLHSLGALLLTAGACSVMWELAALHAQNGLFTDEMRPELFTLAVPASITNSSEWRAIDSSGNAEISSDDLLHLSFLEAACQVENDTVLPWTFAAPGNAADRSFPNPQANADAVPVAGSSDEDGQDPVVAQGKPVYLMAPTVDFNTKVAPRLANFTRSVMELTDVVLCRTMRCDQDIKHFLMRQIKDNEDESSASIKNTRVLYTSQVTADPANFARKMLDGDAAPQNVADFAYTRFVHATWKVSSRTTQDVFNCWKTHKNELPPLDVYLLRAIHENKQNDGTRYYKPFPGDSDTKVQVLDAIKFSKKFGEASFFICPTAEDDCLDLARASGGVIVTADAYPMNEFVSTRSEGVTFPTQQSTALHPERRSLVSDDSLLLPSLPATYRSSDLCSAVLKIKSSLSLNERKNIGLQTRRRFHEDAKYFILIKSGAKDMIATAIAEVLTLRPRVPVAFLASTSLSTNTLPQRSNSAGLKPSRKVRAGGPATISEDSFLQLLQQLSADLPKSLQTKLLEIVTPPASAKETPSSQGVGLTRFHRGVQACLLMEELIDAATLLYQGLQPNNSDPADISAVVDSHTLMNALQSAATSQFPRERMVVLIPLFARSTTLAPSQTTKAATALQPNDVYNLLFDLAFKSNMNDIIKVAGTTGSSAAYDYILQLKNEKLSVWIEDCATKEKWYKGDMGQDQFVTSTNAIGGLTPAGYIKFFHALLQSKSSDVQRKLTVREGGALQLELLANIRFQKSTWTMAYTFDLDPVSAERIEELESKLRDQQNEVTRMSRVESKLQEELTRLKTELEAAQVVSFIQLEATGANGLSWLCWEGTESDDFKVTGANSVVKV